AKAKGSLFRAVSLVRAWKGSRPNLLGVGARRLTDARRNIVVSFHEPRRALEHAKHVVNHQDLAIALGRGADADHGRTDGPGYAIGDLFQHPFDDDAEGACLVDSARIREDLVGLVLLTAARAIAAEDVDGLRSQPDMPDHRNAAVR